MTSFFALKPAWLLGFWSWANGQVLGTMAVGAENDFSGKVAKMSFANVGKIEKRVT